MAVDPGCSLYVDAEDPGLVLADLCRHYGVVDQFGTLTVPQMTVRVSRNKFHHHHGQQAADPDFLDWPTLLEIDPTEPISSVQLGEPRPDADTGAGPWRSTVDLAPAVTHLIAQLRRLGNRVVASCDYEERLPRWDQLRGSHIDGGDLDDGYDTGDDRYTHQGVLFTGTVIERREDGGWHETEASNGVTDGLARTYRPGGRLWREDWYDQGSRVRKRRWHDNGRLRLDARRYDASSQLAVQRWTEDGQRVRRSLLLRLSGRPEIDREPRWL